MYDEKLINIFLLFSSSLKLFLKKTDNNVLFRKRKIWPSQSYTRLQAL